MIRLPWKRVETKANHYAMRDDFCRVFTKERDNLYGLLFLLTKDHTKAETCFVAGLEDCMTANQVFKDWAHSWAKRALIQQAIRELKPQPDRQAPSPSHGVAEAIHLIALIADPKLQAAMAGVLALDKFERFVFVMSVLERYSDHECSLLLSCASQDIREARSRALEQIAADDQGVTHGGHTRQAVLDIA